MSVGSAAAAWRRLCGHGLAGCGSTRAGRLASALGSSAALRELENQRVLQRSRALHPNPPHCQSAPSEVFRSLLVGLLCLSACAGAPRARPQSPPLSPARLMPLALGNAWSYDVDAGDGEAVLAIVRVTAVTADGAVVSAGQGERRYLRRPDGVFREDRGGYLLRAPIVADAPAWDAGDGVRAQVAAVGLRIQTSAGSFEQCVRIHESGGPQGTVIDTVYCPDVGPVEVRSSLALSRQTVTVIARLRGYRLTGPQALEHPH